ncbi:MAG TPA: phosphatidylserine decarboxylase [Candidatus Acidoferrum sp.]|nr:phosphatidylserine decarboxylase [Candidatus Acidoferrum sp.]
MAAGPIQYFNRYTGRLETEDVYGHSFLKWTYGNPLGRLSLHALVKRSAFSRWYGWRMSGSRSRAKVAPFISTYKVDCSELACAPSSYKTFNEFFYRELKPGARPIAAGKDVAVFPADGRHLGFQDISKVEGIFVKGAVFDLRTLMQSDELARRYAQGSMVLSRLCPVDYHRFHFPVSGVPSRPVFIEGPLYSVNPIALRRNIHIFSQNKRAYCEIDSPEFGRVLMFEIGATCVGSFEYTYQPGVPVEKGAEKGYFKFGGSSTMTFFEPSRITLDTDLLEQSRAGIELYAKMGDRIGAMPKR